MNYNERNKRNYIIFGLYAIVAIMAVGFAAFSQQLTINSTSEVTSTWDVHIKDNGVIYKDAVDATSTLAEKTSNLVATFTCSLTTPGTSTISYDVVVENKGSLNAKLDSIELTGGNDAISVVTSPTNASLATSPIVLGPNDETTITVTVSYNDIITVPTGDGLRTSIVAKLNFSQTNDDPVVPTPSPTFVYAFHRDYKCVDDNCVTNDGYSRIITDGVSDYTQLSSYQNGRTFFLKYELNGDNEIQKAWACQKFSFIDEPICLLGGSTENNLSNLEMLRGYEDTFSQNGGNCRLSDEGGDCYKSSENENIDPYFAEVRSSSYYCSVYSRGYAKCMG